MGRLRSSELSMLVEAEAEAVGVVVVDEEADETAGANNNDEDLLLAALLMLLFDWMLSWRLSSRESLSSGFVVAFVVVVVGFVFSNSIFTIGLSDFELLLMFWLDEVVDEDDGDDVCEERDELAFSIAIRFDDDDVEGLESHICCCTDCFVYH